MTIDNTYRCMWIDPTSGEITLRGKNEYGTVVLAGHGLVTVQVGKTYRLRIEAEMLGGNHRIEFAEEPA